MDRIISSVFPALQLGSDATDISILLKYSSNPLNVVGVGVVGFILRLKSQVLSFIMYKNVYHERLFTKGNMLVTPCLVPCLTGRRP